MVISPGQESGLTNLIVYYTISKVEILEGTLMKHFGNYIDSFEKLIKIIENDMYVDDLVTRGNNLEEVK